MLLLLFIFLPLIEIYFLIKIGSAIGAFTTILIAISTAFIGWALFKSQGQHMMIQLRKNASMGQLSSLVFVESLLVFCSGLFLVTPGFITDTLGFLFVIPFTRKPIAQFIKKWAEKKVKSGQFKVYHSGTSSNHNPPNNNIENNFRDVN